MYNITAAHSEGNWISDMKQYLNLKDSLIDFIVAMSAKHFRETREDCGLENAKEVFAIALSSSTNYYCTVSIIQNLIRETNKKLNTFETKSPYTLTEVYYSKMVLRYLMHLALALKWAQNEVANLLTPEIVLNFFIQWIDPHNMHTDEEVRDLIKEMICDVDRALLLANGGVPLTNVKTNSTGMYTEKEVLLAISHYMYKQRRMAQMTAFSGDTLDVVKTIKSNSGHAICLGAIFEAIARGFGVTSCKLVAFANHAYVEWRCNDGFRFEMMKFSLETGDLSAMGRCPFSRNADPDGVRYYADAFAEYIANNYINYMGLYKSSHLHNALQFLHFLSHPVSERAYGDYYNLILFLRGLDKNELTIPFNMEYMHKEYRDCVHAMLFLNRTPPPQLFDMFVNHRVSEVKYCVGLICFNKVHDYVCVIRHWDTQMEPEFRNHLDNPPQSDQPHYKVIAMDQTERYISQDNLTVVSEPSRIYHLEEILGKEFSHFNGFFYVPNKEKQMLFPDDLSVGNRYASKYKPQRNLIP